MGIAQIARTTGVINRVRISHATSLSNIWYGWGWLDDTVHSVHFCLETNNYDQDKKLKSLVSHTRMTESLLCSSPGLKGTLSLKLKASPPQSVAIFFLSGWMSGSRIWLYVATLTFLGCDCRAVWENISVASRQPEQQHLSTDPAEDFWEGLYQMFA